MDESTLDSIDMTQRGDPGSCLREMLAGWLRGGGDPPRTWKTIATALRNVPLVAIAEEVEAKHGLAPKSKAADPQGIILQYCDLLTTLSCMIKKKKYVCI